MLAQHSEAMLGRPTPGRPEVLKRKQVSQMQALFTGRYPDSLFDFNRDARRRSAAPAAQRRRIYLAVRRR